MIPTLTDGVVTLRAHRAEDVVAAMEQSLDAESQRWTTVPVPYERTDAEFFVTELMPRGWAENTEWGFALEAEGRYAGTVSLRNLGEGRAELGYGAHPAARGKGYVERGLRLLLAWGFEEMDVRTVIWWAHVGNWASRRVAWRLGFTFEGTVRDWQPQRGELRTSWVGTLLREDPREPRTTWLDNPVVEGDGVRLRPFTDADATRVVEGIGDADTQYWLAFMPRDPGEAEGRRYLEQVQERLATQHTITWAFSATDDDRLLGAVGLYRFGDEPEIGYWTHPEARGRGLTTRAAALAVRHAFEELGLSRLAGYASAGNAASLKVLEKLGMQRIGVQRQAAHTGDGTPVDLVGYDLLAAEWADQNSTPMPRTDSAAPTSAGDR
jgi:RimJ/RimL family protein N-acetyltransferase